VGALTSEFSNLKELKKEEEVRWAEELKVYK